MISTLKEVREALKKSIAAAELEGDKFKPENRWHKLSDEATTAITNLDALIAAQERAEPVGYVYSVAGEAIKSAAIPSHIPNGTPLYTAPQPAPITSAATSIAQWLECGAPESFRTVTERDMQIAMRYFAAPSTSPLTLGQIHDALLSICDDGSAPTSIDDPEFVELIVPLARAIEAAHGIGAKP